MTKDELEVTMQVDIDTLTSINRRYRGTLMRIWDEAQNLEPHLVKEIEKTIPEMFQ